MLNKILFGFVSILAVLSVIGCVSIKNSQATGGVASCEKPPQTLEWSGKSYKLKAEHTTSEPGMKFGFMKCDNGKFMVDDSGGDKFIVYSAGNPSTNSDIIFSGSWGLALYSKN